MPDDRRGAFAETANSFRIRQRAVRFTLVDHNLQRAAVRR
jgi:hypothetical protein